MQIERGFEEAFVFAFPASGGGDGCFQVAGAEAFLNRQREGWVRTDFQPDVDAEVGEGLDGAADASDPAQAQEADSMVRSLAVEVVALMLRRIVDDPRLLAPVRAILAGVK